MSLSIDIVNELRASMLKCLRAAAEFQQCVANLNSMGGSHFGTEVAHAFGMLGGPLNAYRTLFDEHGLEIDLACGVGSSDFDELFHDLDAMVARVESAIVDFGGVLQTKAERVHQRPHADRMEWFEKQNKVAFASLVNRLTKFDFGEKRQEMLRQLCVSLLENAPAKVVSGDEETVAREPTPLESEWNSFMFRRYVWQRIYESQHPDFHWSRDGKEMRAEYKDSAPKDVSISAKSFNDSRHKQKEHWSEYSTQSLIDGWEANFGKIN